MHQVEGRGTIPGSYTLLVAQELGLGHDQLAPLLRGADVDRAALVRGEATLTPEQQVRVLENALDLSGDPSFGFRLGRRLTIASHGPLGFLVSTSPDLRTALGAVEAYATTRMSFLRMSFAPGATHSALNGRFAVEAPAAVHRCMAEALSVIVADLAGFVLGRPARDIETDFPHPDPGIAVDALPGPMRFDCASLAFRVPNEVAAEPNASANHAMHELARAQCETILAELAEQPGASSTRRALEQVILSVPSGPLSEEDAAAAMFISARTLARRLAAEGTSFRAVRDDLLARRAAGHLRDGMPVTAIATLLGYHDASGFRRAFKRWYGETPDAWRRSPRIG